MNIKNYDFYYKLRSLPYIEGLYLYGSRSKNEARERSDIDLAISCPSATPAQWQEVRSIIDSADTLLGIDCVRLDELEDSSLKHEIDSTKTVLFERVKNNYPWYNLFLDLGEALEKFEDALRLDPNEYPYVREAVIQIFEYSFELYWKLLKKICMQEGFEVNSPRTTFERAYALSLIDDENTWLEMMEDRNLTSHTYRQPTAQAIYEHCRTYVPIMQSGYMKLKKQFTL